MKQAIKIGQNLDIIRALFRAMKIRKQLVTAIYPRYFIDLYLAEELRSLLQDYNTTTVKDTYRSIFAPLQSQSASLVKYYEEYLKNTVQRIGPESIGAKRLGDAYMLNYDMSTFESFPPSTDREPNIISAGQAMEIRPEMLYAYCFDVSNFFKQMSFTETRGKKPNPGIPKGTTLKEAWAKECKLSYESFIDILIEMQHKGNPIMELHNDGTVYKWIGPLEFAGTIFQYLIGIEAIPEWNMEVRSQVFKNSFSTHLGAGYKSFDNGKFQMEKLKKFDTAFGLKCGYVPE